VDHPLIALPHRGCLDPFGSLSTIIFRSASEIIENQIVNRSLESAFFGTHESGANQRRIRALILRRHGHDSGTVEVPKKLAVRTLPEGRCQQKCCPGATYKLLPSVFDPLFDYIQEPTERVDLLAERLRFLPLDPLVGYLRKIGLGHLTGDARPSISHTIRR
jgi:hypothetical protein